MASVAIVGTGWGARAQVPAFREAGLTVAGIAGYHRTKTARLAAELGIEPFADWRELVASESVDLVTIATPPAEHLLMSTMALDAGKHVVSEKPTALNAAEAQKLVDAARRHPDQIAIIDHELRFLPSFRTARERIGELGSIRYADVRYTSPAWGDPAREWKWWNDAAQGGGVLGAVGSHFTDAMRYFGLEVATVQAFLDATVKERPFGPGSRQATADDFATVSLRFTNGAKGIFSLSSVSSGPDTPAVITIHGEKGAFRLVGEELLFAERGKEFSRIAGGEMARRPGNTQGGAFGSGTVLLAHALRAAIDEGDRGALAPAATFEDGLAQQKVLDAARRSHANQGCWEKV